jgi:hypothetical protein
MGCGEFSGSGTSTFRPHIPTRRPLPPLPLRLLSTCVLILLAADFSRAQAQEFDDDFKIYAVNVVKTPPLEKEFVGFGIFLGNGKVLTAAHVVGNWPTVTHPRVRVAGLDLPATVVKIGSLDDTDLALLSVDETQLPMALRLRRNPLCKVAPPFGARALVVYPERIAATRTISPAFIAPKYRARLSSLIAEPQGSGAGVFLPDRHCLLGIISMKVQKFSYRRQYGRLVASPAGWAGYYVPTSAIAAFLPPESR